MRKKFLLFVLTLASVFCLAIGFSACDNNDDSTDGDDTEQSQTISVTVVTLNKSSLDLSVGESYTLSATVSPSNATNKNVTWSSSNTSVATVSSNGKIKAISEGTATITVTTTDGGYTDTCMVTVKTDTETQVDYSEGLEYTFSSGDNSFSVKGIGTCTDTDIVIPSTYDGYPVTSISDYAFYFCSSFKSVTIGDNVTSIGDRAFSYCKSLMSITIPDSVISIGDYAFIGCSKLIEVYNLSSLTITAGSGENGCVGYYAKNVYTSSEGNSNLVKQSDYIFYNDNGTYYLMGYMGTDTKITLPSLKINGESISYSIYQYAFYNCSSLTSIIIPNSVMSIGSGAFNSCISLTNITIPDSVTSIGGGAFGDCSSLMSITIPDGVTSIDNYAFQGCYKLVEVYNLSSLTITVGSTENGYVGYYAKNVYTHIKGSSNFIEVDDYIFYNDNGTHYLMGYMGTDTKITLPSLKINGELVSYSICQYAFYNCSSLTNITIPDSVTSIGSCAFYNCSSLTNITIPDSVTSIGGGAFCDCTSLVSITIPDNMTSIDYNTFGYCTSLMSITIPDSVTSIGQLAFHYCSSLKSITIGNGVTSIDEDAFDGCSSLTSVYYNGLASQWASISFNNFTANPIYYAGKLYLNGTLATEITLEGVSSISAYAFFNCSSLTSVTIGNRVTSIERYAFAYSSLTSIAIGESLTSIGNSAFLGCHKLVEVYNLSSLTITAGSGEYGWIGYYVKIYTSSEGNSNLVKQSDYIFYKDNGTFYLMGYTGTDTEITLPSLTIDGESISYSIYRYAFYDCTSLTNVTIGNDVTSIGEYAFYGCESLTSVVISNNVEYIEGYAFYGCSSLTEVTIGDSVTSIGEYAFHNCTSLISITIPDSVTSIRSSAFAGCSSLTSITIPNGVTSIGDGAFYYCTSLKVVTIGDSVKAISNRAFSSCSSLERIIVGSGNIVYHSDGNCLIETESKTLILGCKNSVIPTDGSATSIGNSAFYGCSSLTSITIPDSVTSIGGSAFNGCSSLTNVIFENVNRWYVSTSSTATSGITISSTDLANPSTAATYLSSTYYNYYWYRG